MTYIADHRPMFAWSGLSNADGYPHSWHPNWAGVGMTAEQIAANLLTVMLGHTEDRILFWQIGGRDPEIAHGFLTFASWHVLSDAQKKGLEIAWKTWKLQKAGRKIILYLGWTTDPYTREITEYGHGLDVWWHEQIGPLVDIGLDEIALDAGADPFWAAKGLAHITDIMRHHYGIKTMVEAIPLVSTQGNPAGMSAITGRRRGRMGVPSVVAGPTPQTTPPPPPPAPTLITGYVPDEKRLALNPAISWWQTIAPYDWKNWPIISSAHEVHVVGAPPSEYKALADRGMIPGSAA